MFEGTACRLFLPQGWMTNFGTPGTDRESFDVVLYSRKDCNSNRWFLAVRCVNVYANKETLHSEEAPEKPRRLGLSKNHSVSDPSNHYYLIFVIDINDRPTEHQTPRFRKTQESIRLDGGIKLESNTKIFFDGNLFGVFYPAASSVLIYDAETEPTAPALISKRATLEQSFSKLAGHQGTTIKQKEDTSSVLQNKKIFIDLYELGEIS